VTVVGDVVSGPCLRLSDALDSAGVLFVAPDETAGDEAGAVEDDEAPGVCCGIVLCCFWGELPADWGGFFGETMAPMGVRAGLPDGLVTEGGALEYNVTAGVEGTLLALLCMGMNGLGSMLELG